MRVWTYGEALDKVEADFDLVNETFLTADEKVGLFNDALQRAAAEIYKLGVEDEYFTTSATLSLVSGQALYSLPTNIYANKIRAIIYAKGTEIYPVHRIRRRNKFLVKAEINQNVPDADYQYDLVNASIVAGMKIELVPPSRETDNTVMTVNFVREALYVPLVTGGTLAASRATKIDLPEFMTYLFADVKAAIAAKIPHPNLAEFNTSKDRELMAMVTTLTGMVDDDATEVQADYSHYGESS